MSKQKSSKQVEEDEESSDDEEVSGEEGSDDEGSDDEVSDNEEDGEKVVSNEENEEEGSKDGKDGSSEEEEEDGGSEEDRGSEEDGGSEEDVGSEEDGEDKKNCEESDELDDEEASDDEHEEYKVKKTKEGEKSEEDEGSDEENDVEVVKKVKSKSVDNRSLIVLKEKGLKKVSESKKRKQVSYKKNVPKSKKMKHVSEEKKVSKRKKKYESSSSSSEDEKPSKKKQHLLKSKSKKEKIKDSNKKKKKPLTEEQKKRLTYLKEFQNMKSRTVPRTLCAAIRNSRVNMESFLSGIGFSSLFNIDMDTMPSRLARFVVTSFDSKSYEFKLAKGTFVVTSKKVHEILGIPLGGKSLFDLPERSPDDPFIKKWFKQFGNKNLKDIHLTDLASMLVGAKKVDFMFKVNFLMLFANTMCLADTMKGFLNLTVLKRIREDTIISEIDWCGFLHNCLQYSQLPNTGTGYYIGPIAFLIVSFYLLCFYILFIPMLLFYCNLTIFCLFLQALVLGFYEV